MFYQVATTEALSEHPTLYKTETKFVGEKHPASHVAAHVVESGKAEHPVKGGNGFYLEGGPW